MTSILLDLDGTLIDSRAGIIDCLHHAIAALGHTPDPSIDLSWAIGPALEDVAGQILAPYGDDRGPEYVKLYRAHYGEVGLFRCTLYPGIVEALDSFAAAGWPLCLATAKRTDFARRILAHFDLAARFAGIYGAEGAGADHKPELIARLLADQKPDRAVMIGDRFYDIEGAHSNGLPAIGVLWGYGGRAELERVGADALAATPADLPALARRLLAGEHPAPP